MDRRCFVILCHLLRTTSGLASTEVVDVEEMVVMFFGILAHDVKNRMIEREFVWSVDSRILKDATSRPNELRVLKVKYPNVKDFLALYRGQRYHLHEWHGVDRATGARAETFANVGSNLPRGFEEFPANDANDLEIPMMYSQGLNMSPDKGAAHVDRNAECSRHEIISENTQRAKIGVLHRAARR
ncbi:putative nuclease HARBI1 [Cucumis melo var. makuwa]|uniref:Nuclease HARBI1 n=1 Tax=Cucumis melo var. makuwa TaxID=1194695 RepID=A0A5A7TX60_CUCMM|nr:putative nuclease HARBI1 [Cucumis melo var. makuwa]